MGTGPISATLLAGALVVLVFMAVEDVRRRSVPAVGCYAFIACCVAYRACSGGMGQLATGALWAMALCVFAAALNLVKRVRDVRSSEAREDAIPAIGEGDLLCMAGASLASGPAAPYGFAACFMLAGLFSLVALGARRLRVADGFPLVPFFVPWMVLASLA